MKSIWKILSSSKKLKFFPIWSTFSTLSPHESVTIVIFKDFLRAFDFSILKFALYPGAIKLQRR